MSQQPVSSYALYGERDHVVEPGFIHIENVGDRQALHGGRVEPHRHPHLHQLSLWRNGDGVYHIEDNSHFLKGTMLSWIPSSTVHGFAIGGACDAAVISVSDEFLRDQLAGILPATGAMNWREPAIVPVGDEAIGELAALFDSMGAEYAHPASHRSEALSAWAKLIFIAFARLGESHRLAIESPPESWLLFRRFRSLLDRQGNGARTVAGIAEELATTPYLLNKAVRGATGLGPAAVMRQHTVLEAKRLLLFTELKVAHVAFTLGFDDPAHFGRLFRRETGLSPAQWRKDRHGSMERAAGSGGKGS